MGWRCRECDRTYEDPPETCRCGSTDVEPDDGGRESRYSLLAVRRRLLEPRSADRSLVDGDPRVGLVFRALFLLSVLALVSLAVVLLV
ncbi:hypothetical protein [Natronomonas marina]|uniref:hypothetical protein n=1 Tax=Natronomonas marina TaxID=2961939 RepID=UPI0020C9E9C5|nr:hypothetical protein [Natronomonas marina]